MKSKNMKKILTILPLILIMACAKAQINADYYLFKWTWGPNEKAFKILLPQNWILQ